MTNGYLNEKDSVVAEPTNGGLTPACVEQIMRNYQEDYGFAEILERFQRKEFAQMATIPICKTPLSLALVGADTSFDLVVNPSTLVKCMSSPESKFHGHNLDENVLKYLVFELRNPSMVFKGSKEGSFVFVTDLKDREDRPVVVVTALNRMNGHHLVNQVTSAYGRERFELYVERQIKNGNLIAVNKNKANQLLQSSGHDWPIEEAPISFDNSIAYTLENVKGLSEKILDKNNEFSSNAQAKEKPTVESYALGVNSDIIGKFLVENEKIVDMVRFFEYAGDDIYKSLLWQQFLQDKEFLKDSEVVGKLHEVLCNARNLDKITSGEKVKTPEQNMDLF